MLVGLRRRLAEDGLPDRRAAVASPGGSSVDTQERQLIDTSNRQLAERGRNVDSGCANAGSIAGMSNVLDDEEQQRIRTLGRSDGRCPAFSRRRGVRRETISRYLYAQAVLFISLTSVTEH